MDNAKVHCDACRKEGLRPRMHPAPDNWLYLEAKDDEDPENPIIVLACSVACALELWQEGPGPRWPPDPLRPSKDES